MPNPSTEPGAPTQESLVAGHPALNYLSATLATEEEPALQEYDEPLALPLEEPVPSVCPGAYTTLSDPEEIARLRRLLAEKGRVNLRFALAESELSQRLEEAKEINAELRTQLQAIHSTEVTDPADLPGQAPKPAGASAEVAKLQADWRRAMQSLDREYRERKTELVMVRGQLHQTQRQLEQEYGARQAEAAKYSANIANLETDLAEALGAATNSHRSQSRDRTHRLLITAMVTAIALTVALTIWMIGPKVSSRQCVAAETQQIAVAGNNPSSAVAEAPPAPALSLPGVTPANNLAAIQAPRSEPGLAGGMNRLDGALAAFPNRRPEDILREIHQKAAKLDPSVCAFEWNNGQPSLLYGGAGKLTLAATVEKCADAIEKYHR